MSRSNGRKAKLDDDDDGDENGIASMFDEKFGVRLTAHFVTRTMLYAYLVAFGLHVLYNAYEGHYSSLNHIDHQTKYYSDCQTSQVMQLDHWALCQQARIEKDMSVWWLTVNRVLHTTTPCVAFNCGTVIREFLTGLNWLVAGAAVVLALWQCTAFAAARGRQYRGASIDWARNSEGPPPQQRLIELNSR